MSIVRTDTCRHLYVLRVSLATANIMFKPYSSKAGVLVAIRNRSGCFTRERAAAMALVGTSIIPLPATCAGRDGVAATNRPQAIQQRHIFTLVVNNQVVSAIQLHAS